MNAVLRLTQSHVPPERAPAPVRHAPLELRPIPWGQPDKALGLALCQHISEATPAIVVPFNPRTFRRLKRDISHYNHY